MSRQTKSAVRTVVTLSKRLLAKLQSAASAHHGGDFDRFVAAAIRYYLLHFRKDRHTARLRKSYRAAAKPGRKIALEWSTTESNLL